MNYILIKEESAHDFEVLSKLGPMGKQAKLPVGPINQGRAYKLQRVFKLLVKDSVSNEIDDEA